VRTILAATVPIHAIRSRTQGEDERPYSHPSSAFGRLVGTAVRYLQITYPAWGVWSGCQHGDPTCITPGIYALVGDAAVLGGVTRMTIALVVIMFEITAGITYLLPIMIAVITSRGRRGFVRSHST
jgi:H+/Cl- antiporter ClcA